LFQISFSDEKTAFNMLIGMVIGNQHKYVTNFV